MRLLSELADGRHGVERPRRRPRAAPPSARAAARRCAELLVDGGAQPRRALAASPMTPRRRRGAARAAPRGAPWRRRRRRAGAQSREREQLVGHPAERGDDHDRCPVAGRRRAPLRTMLDEAFDRRAIGHRRPAELHDDAVTSAPPSEHALGDHQLGVQHRGARRAAHRVVAERHELVAEHAGRRAGGRPTPSCRRRGPRRAAAAGGSARRGRRRGCSGALGSPQLLRPAR